MSRPAPVPGHAPGGTPAAKGQAVVGIDIGGTFTDLVCVLADGTLRLAKLRSTPSNPARAVLDAVNHLREAWGVDPASIGRFVHGTTVATNAVIERKGARIGFIASEGFRDLLEIGRGNRREIYDTVLKPQAPVFLAPRHLRRDVPARLDARGSVVQPLDEAALLAAVDELVALDVRAIAIVFLFSFLDPAQERRARELILQKHPQLAVSLSSEVDPAFREYERACVTAFDAYVKPVLDQYLSRMEKGLAEAGVPARLQIMQSRGGVSSAGVARAQPVRLFLSGPAAGAIGGAMTGRAVGRHDLISVDIGGTSCDIALAADGVPLLRSEGSIEGHPVRVAMVDVNAIGAGGGSLAWLDGAGTLRVGPHSAGADPGPACYARGGTEPTVTDASLALGWLDPANFAGGTVALDVDCARAAIRERIALPLGLDIERAALGIHRVVNAQMAEGIRLASIHRGIDPRGFSLVALGGGGGLHACALAEELDIAEVLVPRHPGVLSAIGLLAAPVEHEALVACARPIDGADAADILSRLATLDEACAAAMREEGHAAAYGQHAAAGEGARMAIRHLADVCFIGQSSHVSVPLASGDPSTMLAQLYEDFLAAHERIYGHSSREPARIVNLRSVHGIASGYAHAAATLPGPASDAGAALPARRRAIWLPGAAEPVEARIIDREGLAAGECFDGPALVEQVDTTTLVPSGWTGEVAPGGELVLTRRPR
ncbi:MAG: hydantoinase/oxoprolinase family protein [Burkholderiales bacterium]|nr:hydantoinase/oxoprolinase family protein [Burkholderiales bacterium]